MHWIDWSILVGLMVFVVSMATYTKRFTLSVADFLAANRCAGRYMLSIAEAEANLGAISIIALFQMNYSAGFTTQWWQCINKPIGLIILLSGFVIYRYRQTRVLTLAEFFEKRYSKNLRKFAGLIMFITGVLNFGIFPAVGSRFFIYYLSLPSEYSLLGYSIPTFPSLMAGLLIVSLYFTFMGGQIAVMVTDFLQGMFSNIVFIIILCFIFITISWGTITEGLLQVPSAESMVHPFKGSKIQDFNAWYFLMSAFLMVYGTKAWQGSQGYNVSAITPHEAKMGGILGGIRGYNLILITLMIPIVAFILLNHPQFSGTAEQINGSLDRIQNGEIRHQMTVPVAMSHFLPIGLNGAFCAIFLAAFISTHDTYLHSWGSMFIQDVVMPFRKKPFGQKEHMLMLRAAIIGVAIFIFFFSLVFKQNDRILIWFQLVGSIYLSGAGALIIGGLYWKKGTTKAAFAALISGSTLATTGIIIRQINPDFFLNGMQIAFLNAFIASGVYVFVSLIDPQGDYNLDKLLNRGAYAVEGDRSKGTASKLDKIYKKFGITDEFSITDKIIYFFVLGFGILLFVIFLIGTLYNLAFEVSNSVWLKYWRIYVYIYSFFALVFTVWLAIGGFIDMNKMFKRLKQIDRDEADDGWIQGTDKDKQDVKQEA